MADLAAAANEAIAAACPALFELLSPLGRRAFFPPDIPFLPSWGEPLLFGPGSILDAHTDEDRVRLDELHAAAETYAAIATTLLAEA